MLFQPFLRFYVTDIQPGAVWTPITVSTLLEILLDYAKRPQEVVMFRRFNPS
jgi:hypothetical protein